LAEHGRVPDQESPVEKSVKFVLKRLKGKKFLAFNLGTSVNKMETNTYDYLGKWVAPGTKLSTSSFHDKNGQAPAY